MYTRYLKKINLLSPIFYAAWLWVGTPNGKIGANTKYFETSSVLTSFIQVNSVDQKGVKGKGLQNMSLEKLSNQPKK